MVLFCVSMDLPEQVPGDPSPIRPYSSVHNYHDGSGALKFQNTSVREVCWNTANAAEMEGEKTGRAYSFRHSKNIRDNVAAAIDALKNGRTETQRWVEYGSELVAIPVDDMQFEDFLTDFVPEPPKATKRVMNNVLDARQSIRRIYTSSPTTEGIRGTAWGVVSSAGEFLDHKRSFRTPETYVSRTMLKPEYGKHQAMSLIADIVGYDNEGLLAKVGN
jgi:phage/plasmid-like protein (TIGR03299 family)